MPCQRRSVGNTSGGGRAGIGEGVRAGASRRWRRGSDRMSEKHTRFPEAAEHKAGDSWWKPAENIHEAVIVYHLLACEWLQRTTLHHPQDASRVGSVGSVAPAAPQTFSNPLQQLFLRPSHRAKSPAWTVAGRSFTITSGPSPAVATTTPAAPPPALCCCSGSADMESGIISG